MSNFDVEARRQRRRNLLIVEGNHEKNELFGLIFQCFPEISIDMNDVWIYGTNIYMLYDDIAKEYGSDWTDVDVDLPFVVSKKNDLDPICYKEDFVNIILIFDYERHDTNFSEDKIVEMQNYFKDPTDSGKLYINYPMIESYQHLKELPDPMYAERKIPVTLQPGKKYKGLVREETVVGKFIEFPKKVEELLKNHFGISEEALWMQCFKEILDISSTDSLEEKTEAILQGKIEESKLETAKYHFKALISKMGYVQQGKSYWMYMREMFQKIIIYNICKANRIQKDKYQLRKMEYKESFEVLDFTEILRRQNISSRDLVNGYIWVLSTCVFFVAEYNFSLVAE